MSTCALFFSVLQFFSSSIFSFSVFRRAFCDINIFAFFVIVLPYVRNRILNISCHEFWSEVGYAQESLLHEG